VRRPRRPCGIRAAALLAPVLAPVLALAALAAPASADVVLLPPHIGPTTGIGYGHAERPPSSCGPRATGAPEPVHVLVTPRRGAVAVSWWVRDADVVQLAVAAVPQALVAGKQPPVRWRTVRAGSTCRWTNRTFPGLKRGATYVIWVDARLRRHDGRRGLSDRLVGRTSVFRAA
jgi:hypothetical protein